MVLRKTVGAEEGVTNTEMLKDKSVILKAFYNQNNSMILCRSAWGQNYMLQHNLFHPHIRLNELWLNILLAQCIGF